MISYIKKIALYNEETKFIQQNVLVLCCIAFLDIFFVILNIANGLYSRIITDVIVLSIFALIWVGIRFYGVYYVNIVFAFLIPALSIAIYDSMSVMGVASSVWAFPVVTAVFFCFHKKLALISAGILTTVITTTAFVYFDTLQAFQTVIPLLMVVYCLIKAFSVIYNNYTNLEHQVKIDYLTGLYNRQSLDSYVNATIRKKHTYRPSVLYIDIDDFKKINDSYGHNIGDVCLKNSANLFKKYAPDAKYIFRLGGEEFLILFENLSEKTVQAVCENVRREMSEADLLGNQKQVTISAGLAIHNPTENLHDWFKRADDALYKAKNSGKNAIVKAG